MIPFERNPGQDRDPNGGSREGFDWGVERRAGVDAALRRSAPKPPPPSRVTALAGWLVAPMFLAATAAALLLVLRGPDSLFAMAFGLVLVIGLAWILVSSLYPARADRVCPQCGRAGLTRLDRKSLHGLRCRTCQWRDESASAFLHVEEEGKPFEDLVRRERRRFRRW